MTIFLTVIVILTMAKIVIPFIWNVCIADLVNVIISPFTDWRVSKMKK